MLTGVKVTDRSNGGHGAHLLPTLLRMARERAGLTQLEMAERCSVSQPAVAGWESGKRPAMETTIEKVAVALGVTVEEMLRRELMCRMHPRRVPNEKDKHEPDGAPVEEPAEATG